MLNDATSPIIIAGMHRSGTSLMTRLLEKLGLFVGENLESNHESTFFLSLNRWLLEIAGARWDQPEPFRYLLNSDEDRSLAVDYLEQRLKSPASTEFLGWRQFMERCFGKSSKRNWGWKDPRNSITLPIWLQLFPSAKVVCLKRHGVDVAKSLQKRREKKAERGRSRYERLKNMIPPVYWLREKKSGFGGSVRCSSLEGGFSLWEQYLEKLEEYRRRLSCPFLTVRYEELLQEPKVQISRVADYCGLGFSTEKVETLAQEVEASRSLAYRETPHLRDFAETRCNRLEEHGY